MNEDCQRKYEFNSYSKEQILKVIALMSILFSNNYILGSVWTDPVGGEVQRLQNFPLPLPLPLRPMGFLLQLVCRQNVGSDRINC